MENTNTINLALSEEELIIIFNALIEKTANTISAILKEVTDALKDIDIEQVKKLITDNWL